MRMSAADFQALSKRKRGNKYHAKADFRCETCGSAAIFGGACKSCGSQQVRRFDSKAEASRYDRLRLLERAGQIRDLRCQVPFPIEINSQAIGKYVADFTYHNAAGELVVEDVKGTDTPLSRFKRKAVEAGHEITITVIRQ